jgi:hypothetical protein
MLCNSLQPTLVAVSNKIAFANPKAPVYPRLALGKTWNEVDFLALNINCWVRLIYSEISLNGGLLLYLAR